MYWVKSYYRKKFFFVKMTNFSFCSIEAKPLILDEIWRHACEILLQELSNALLCSTVALLVPVLCASLPKNVEIVQIWLVDLWWPDLWPDLKNDQDSFVMIFDGLSNAAYRMSLRGPGAELEGALKSPPPIRWWKISRPIRARVKVEWIFAHRASSDKQ